MKRYLLVLLLVLLQIQAHSQELTVKEFAEKTNDLAASVYERKDEKGNSCALVKVQLARAGAEFSPNVVGSVDYKVNEYWVYLPTISQHLEVKHPNFSTKDIVFADYGVKLNPKTTYILTLSLLEKSSALQMATSQYLVFNLNPKDAIIEVNGETWTNTNGCSRKLVPFGDYAYTIRASNYRTHTNTVTVNDPINKVVVNVNLEHEFGSVNIPSSVSMDGATVYIDGKNVGTAPLFLRNILSGNHVLEVKKEGYLTCKENITIHDGQTYSIENLELSKVPVISFTINGSTFDMVKVEAGIFNMGETDKYLDPFDEARPVHQVTLTNNYYLGKYEVTQGLWKAVMGCNPSRFKGDNLPVENVSWDDCQKFIGKLNRLTGKNFRLPTEAEWEYAAKGGNKSRGYRYSGSNNLSDVAWYDENSGNKTHPVGTKQPNELGIYDMSGNVEEWCYDWYDNYSSSPQTNPMGPNTGDDRKARGGHWDTIKDFCLSSWRSSYYPDRCLDYLGLRLCLSENETVKSVDDLESKSETNESEVQDKALSNSSANTLSFTVNDVSFDMIKVEAGTFMMGATPEMEDADPDEKPVHQVTLTNNYYLGKYEVTQALWKAVMGRNPSCFNGDNLPVSDLNWSDCQAFLFKLNRLTGKNFRLPTEAEWEYAARGGNNSRGYKYSGSNNLENVAWYNGNSDRRTHPVGTKQPNELGIYDMSGNVSERCQDWYGNYSSTAQTNPKGPASGYCRIQRGGSWRDYMIDCRSLARRRNQIDYGGHLGLRLCLSE